VQQLEREGREAWPGLAVSSEAFARFVEARAPLPDGAPGADLFLACACLERVPGAHDAFDRQLLTQLPQLLTRLRQGPGFIDEVAQLLREKLFVGPSARVADYSGKGSLLAWLRVVAVRVAIDLLRARGAEPASLEHEPELLAAGQGPELEALRNRYRPLFKQAFAESLATLTAEQRTLLRLHYLDGLNMEELGKLFKVNRSSIFRRLGNCSEALLSGMRVRLGQQLGLDSAEFRSLADAIRSDLDLSLEGWLRVER
jgi:RNA polymerase sigma-70 factor (ECF subfamily)